MIPNDDELQTVDDTEAPVSHPSDALLLDWMHRLKSGKRGQETDDIARTIIMDFRLRQFYGVPQSPITLGWLAEILDAILEHQDVYQATGLLPRPKKRPANPQRGWDISSWIKVAKGRGYSQAEAIKLAAVTFSTDESNVRKLIKNEPDWMNPDGKVWDEYFKINGRLLPLPKTGNK